MKEQYMFGDDLLVASIVSPADKTTGMASRKVWLPKGEKWYNMVSGKMYEGSDEEIEIHCTQAENPYFAKAGSIIPMYPKSVRNLQQTLNSYVLTFIPGGDGETTIYEDDGKSKEYSTAYATTKVTKRTEGNRVVVTIAPRKGTYEGATATTTYELRMPANYPPKAVRVNGKELKYHTFWDGSPGFTRKNWTFEKYAAEVDKVTPKQAKKWVKGSLDDWARDIIKQAHRCYKITPEGTDVAKMTNEQKQAVLELSDEMAMKAAYRLAHVLNTIFAK